MEGEWNHNKKVATIADRRLCRRYNHQQIQDEVISANNIVRHVSQFVRKGSLILKLFYVNISNGAVRRVKGLLEGKDPLTQNSVRSMVKKIRVN
ncbi:hypothetical protein NPIL_598681 [Nephila pilipes]|uniref:Uncharacterized protein n=1 Tax=Nephila pilipes TaxID=299642 RepID=A0A8X6TB84_NEPPI|nr:hypothetical protein NPIL_598681 [Nephila pilipes]